MNRELLDRLFAEGKINVNRTGLFDQPPEPLWWLDWYLGVARDLEGDTCYLARTPNYPDFEGSIHRFVDLEVREAFRRGKPTVEACDY